MPRSIVYEGWEGMARIGIITAEADENVLALASTLELRGHEALWIDTSHFSPENRFAFRGDRVSYRGEDLEDVRAFFLRSVMSPIPPASVEDGELVLYDDWYQDYMVARERHGFWLSWMIALMRHGKPFVNPPALANLDPLKPLQLVDLKRRGIPTPRTLITNSPEEVRSFLAEVGEVVYKPVLGGAYCRRLDAEALERLEAIASSPVIFQEYVPGDNVRVTALPDRILSACVVAGDEVDFRAGEAFLMGGEPMTEVELPPAVRALCWAAMQACGQLFSGIDLKRTPSGEYVLLECNFRPAWRHVERGTGAPITEGLVDFLLRQGN